MGLKKAIVTLTNQFGDVVTRHMPIEAVVFHYGKGTVQVVFAMYASEEAKARGAAPEYQSMEMPFDPTDPEEMQMVLSVSDLLWTKIVAFPAMGDFSETNKEGKAVERTLSLNDLNAQIVDA